MRQIGEFIRQYKYSFIIAISLIVIVLTLSFMYSFSETATDSGWDGVVAREFTSGTGSEANPYVISNASEFAHFKELLEGEDASAYVDKYYVITNGFNYGNYDISIDNEVPFSGTIDGLGSLIYNITISNSLFNEIENATIKNINFGDIEYSLTEETGALLANNISESVIDMVLFSGNATAVAESSFGGLVYTSNNSEYSNVILNINIDSESTMIYNFSYELDGDEGSNILIKSNDYENTSSETDIIFNTFNDIGSITDIESYTNEDYKLAIVDDQIVIQNIETNMDEIENSDEVKDTPSSNSKAPTRGVSTSTITEHASGIDGTTLYINDVTADYNYFKGLNFTDVRTTSIPSGVNTGYYNDNYLVKVEIIYDGRDINNANLVGAVSPINNENTNKLVYFKYYPLVRNANGTLATDSNGDNYITIDLIDNPFSKRPYITQNNTTVEYGFHNWVCNQNDDTTTDLCSFAKFSFDEDDYTRHLQVPVDGGSEIIIHLNASWYRANVVTSSNNISSFNSMSMQPAYYTVNENVSHYGKAYWRENMTQMVFLRTYVRKDDADGYMPAGTWFKTNQYDTTYTYNSRETRCSNNRTCYTYTANTSAIPADTQYTGGNVTLVLNFRPNNSNTESTISNFDWNYMYIVDDPSGPYSHTGMEPVPYSYFSNNDNVSGYYYKVSSPTSQMIDTGEYYNASGVVCTNASSCTTAYKLIQYDDSVTNSKGNSISTIELDANSKVVDTNKYYYLVTRDMNIFRYTSNTALTTDNLEVAKPFTVTGTSLTGTSATGVLDYYYTTSWWSGNRTYYDFAVADDLVIENIKINGPDTTGSNNLQLGGASKTTQVIYANSHNLKIGRNVTSSDGTNYLVGEAIFGGSNTGNVSGTFRVILESGIFYAYHSGVTSGSSNYTLNETTIFGSDYDRITSHNERLRFLIGLDGYAGGHNTAGSDSMYASFNIVKSGTYGYNSNGTPNTDNTAGMYIGGRSSQCVESITGAKIEGGNINFVVGGYGYNGSTTTNSTYIGMSGGTVRSIYGGAGHSTTKGNRIVNVTGGTVSYSVLGGSDSYNSGEDDDGITQGSTLVYVGGTAFIGGGTGTVQGVESGSVFGAGGGDTTSDQKGTVYNSHVIINGGTVSTSVYGGGNYGSTGTQSSSASTAVIDVYAGTIGTIYGGSKAAGFSKSNYDTSSMIDINIIGGTIGAVYGGSDADGDINGSVDIGITGGTITGNVYGGGKGSPTTVTNNIDINIGNQSGGPTIGGNVYGGSALGSVNSQSKGTVDIAVNNGTITGSVFGGGEGSSSVSATVYGDISIDVASGTVGNIYGGADTSGVASSDVSVNVTGGTVSNNIYGGGKGANTYVKGDVDVLIGTANVPNIPTINGSVYGGSAFGTVNRASSSGTATGNTEVTVNNGVIVGSVFGGGEGSATYTPYVLGDIDVNINGGDISQVFGGNDQAGSLTQSVEVHLSGGTIGSVFGGGNKSSVTTTHVYESGSNVTNIYGGSNTSGDVTTANVDVTSGTIQNIYGGNNEGGTCGTTNVTIEGTATINGSVFGGGNEVNTTTTNITLTSANGTIPNVYGGGNKASVTTSNITKNGITVTNMFGGSNTSGTVANSNVYHNNGTTTNLYGGNNAGGNTITSTVNVTGGTITNIYGGGNNANGSTSNVTISGGSVTTAFGGGNNAGLNTSNVNVTGGTVSEVYGGSNNTGTVPTSNVTINSSSGTITNVYGGGNRAQVGSTNVVVTTGTIGNIYGGGNLAQVTGNTVVDINGGTINTNVYGGGNYGVVNGNTAVTITNAQVLGNAHAGGNGSTATVIGNVAITIDGNTVIGTSSSVAPNSGCVFGGGNQAVTGTQASHNSTSSVNIVGGTFYGNIYGGAKFSVIYGNTIVNVGQTAYTNQNLIKTDIDIKGNVFGGGEANASGSEIYDWSFISVTEGVNIVIDGDTYNNFNIDGSFFGGGNASSTSGDSHLTIRNYGVTGTPERNVSIQRATYVVIDNSSILLRGAIDKANEYDDELFSVSRVESFTIQNNSEIYFATGVNLMEAFTSLDSNGNPAVVNINTSTNTVTKTVDNRIYVYPGKNINISHDQQAASYGDVTGMTFFGLFNYDNNSVNTGIYNPIYDAGDTLSWSGTFPKGSYVLGRHLPNHNIQVNGFYTNHINADTEINEVDYIEPTPADSPFYRWLVGENVREYTIGLTASKYSTMGATEYSFLDFTRPNTSFEILSFDSSEIATGVSLINRNDIPRIAASANDANNKFGLSIEASNSGWLTTGKTSFYTTSPNISGVTYYEGENSSGAPSMLFYLYHSKNLTEAKSLGTVKISVMAITQLSAIASEVERFVINVNMSTALFQTVEYEGAMTPGDKYDLFTSTATNITNKSKYSAYYSLYAENQNVYRAGYHRALTSTFVLPENTKITMLDFVNGTPEYYYHVITASDVSTAQTEFSQRNECSYDLSMFTTMGSINSNSNYDDATMNAAYYDGTNSNEEFIFIVDFADTNITTDKLNEVLLIEIRDSQDEAIITVLGQQHNKLTYSVYTGRDSQIDIDVDTSLNPLYIGYNDTFDVTINYQNSSLSGTSIIDTQYLDSKMGVQIYLINGEGNVVSGTDLTGAYFLMDNVRYYPDIAGYTHIKLTNKVGNTEKWIVFNTENAGLATGTYQFVFEAFASPDGIYYSSGMPDYYRENINIINSTYGLNPIIDEDSTIFTSNNDKSLDFTIDYTSLLSSPNFRMMMYRRKYDQVYSTNYEVVDMRNYVDANLTASSNIGEYMLDNNPIGHKEYTLPFKSSLTTGTYIISFRLYDANTLIGEVNRYIIIK